MQSHQKVLRRFITATTIALSLSATVAIAEESTYFVQQSFYAEKGKHITTNYHVGTLIPINTRAKITDMGRKKMEVEFPDLGNMTIKIENAEKHSQKNMEEIKNRMFGVKEVSLKEYSAETQEAIKNGQVKTGMSKNEVLLAYGYPPAHATASTDSDQWTYWQNRWNRIIVEFQDNKVKNIRD